MGRAPATALNGCVDATSEVPIMNPGASRSTHELRFTSLFDEGRGYAFPCDAQGRVDLDALSERARNNYLFARSVIGREVTPPTVRTCRLQ
jgi:hypothetical protein